jgi:hypothetical protein
MNKRLKDLLADKRSVIIERWFKEALNPFPSEERSFLRRQKNEFANPVGATIRQVLDGLYDALLEETNPDQVASSLEPMIHVQAVQDFSPSRAVSFLPALKTIVRDETAKEIFEKNLVEGLWQLDAEIDQWILLAFDLYMGCREKIFRIRLWEREKIKAGSRSHPVGEREPSEVPDSEMKVE